MFQKDWSLRSGDILVAVLHPRSANFSQWLAAHALTADAVKNAVHLEFDAEVGKIFRPEYFVAIAASVGRSEDRARIEQMLEQTDLDHPLLDEILARYNLKLPNP